jgi:dTDP-glucose 4,6-dehydratase
MQNNQTILITGGAGFIGSHVVRRFVNNYPACRVINFDALTYAGNPDNLRDIADKPNYEFIKGDINDAEQVYAVLADKKVNGIIHLAAESHVDRSIDGPIAFVKTNVLGTATILDAARKIWKEQNVDGKFYHISTDEVYGELGDTGYFRILY